MAVFIGSVGKDEKLAAKVFKLERAGKMHESVVRQVRKLLQSGGKEDLKKAKNIINRYR